MLQIKTHVFLLVAPKIGSLTPPVSRPRPTGSHTQEIRKFPRIQHLPHERHTLRELVLVEYFAVDLFPDGFRVTSEPLRRSCHVGRQNRAVTESPLQEHVHELAVLAWQLRPLESQLQRYLIHGVVDNCQVRCNVRYAFADWEGFVEGGRVEGEQAGDNARRVAVEEMVVHACEISHLGEYVNEGMGVG